jgi:hypothetical protein
MNLNTTSRAISHATKGESKSARVIEKGKGLLKGKPPYPWKTSQQKLSPKTLTRLDLAKNAKSRGFSN